MKNKVDRHALQSGLAAYHRAVADGELAESRLDQMIDDLGAIVPHAGFSDLLFWGERERTDEEVIDEAIRREELWLAKGELSLLVHIETQLRAALEYPDFDEPFRSYAEVELSQVAEKIRALSSGQTH
jgi:hypothetical protein